MKEKDRVAGEWREWERRDRANGAGGRFSKQKALEFLEKLEVKFGQRDDLTNPEKKSLGKVQREIRRLQRSMRPGWLERMVRDLHNPVARFIAKFLKAFRENIHARSVFGNRRDGSKKLPVPGKFSGPGEDAKKKPSMHKQQERWSFSDLARGTLPLHAGKENKRTGGVARSEENKLPAHKEGQRQELYPPKARGIQHRAEEYARLSAKLHRAIPIERASGQEKAPILSVNKSYKHGK